jgi:hypothetical protein
MFSVSRAAAGAAVIGAVALGVGSASAVTIDFGTRSGSFAPYVEDGLSFNLANLTNGQCPALGACLLQNNGANSTITMTAVDGGAFDLLGFSYQFIGDTKWKRGVLTVSDGTTLTFAQSDLGNSPLTIYLRDAFLGVSQITFSYSGPGTGRLDDVAAEHVIVEQVVAETETRAIPLPASLSLLLAGLAAFGLFGGKRRA